MVPTIKYPCLNGLNNFPMNESDSSLNTCTTGLYVTEGSSAGTITIE